MKRKNKFDVFLEDTISKASIKLSLSDVNVCLGALDYVLKHRTEKEAKNLNLGDDVIKKTRHNIGIAVTGTAIESFPKFIAKCEDLINSETKKGKPRVKRSK